MEIRDPIHQFITVSELERRIIDTAPVQRLRRIHQLSTGWLVWPGAQHTRFEHALGTMELAGRALQAAFDNSDAGVLQKLGLNSSARQERMLAAVRLGGLLHDVGHPAFSHGSEELLPEVAGVTLDHEELSARIIGESEIAERIREDGIDAVDIDTLIEIAVGPVHRNIENQTVRLLSDLVTGAVGVDRMDYLLRDSQACGVAYGQFDISRLISSLEISERNESGGPVWTVPEGAQHDAEQMLLARWFMHLQVYTHKTRRVLDHHLKQFLSGWLPGGRFPADREAFHKIDDYSVLVAAYASNEPAARALTRRQHLRLVRQFTRKDFASPAEFDSFADELRRAYQDVWSDRFEVSFLKDGDGELWIQNDGQLTSLAKASAVVELMKPRWIGRIYAPLDQRSAVAKHIQNQVGGST